MLVSAPDALQPGRARLRRQLVTSSRSPATAQSASISHFWPPATSVDAAQLDRSDRGDGQRRRPPARATAGAIREQVERQRQPQLGRRRTITSASWTMRDSSGRSPVTIRTSAERDRLAGAPTATSCRSIATRGKIAARARRDLTGCCRYADSCRSSSARISRIRGATQPRSTRRPASAEGQQCGWQLSAHRHISPPAAALPAVAGSHDHLDCVCLPSFSCGMADTGPATRSTACTSRAGTSSRRAARATSARSTCSRDRSSRSGCRRSPSTKNNEWPRGDCSGGLTISTPLLTR